MSYNIREVLEEIIEELDRLEDIPVSSATMSRARQALKWAKDASEAAQSNYLRGFSQRQ